MRGDIHHDSLTGLGHRYDGPLCSWHCSIHNARQPAWSAQ